jgi:hypothetical protein
MFERIAEFLQIRFYVRENCAPLRRRIASEATTLFAGWIIVISGRRVSAKIDSSSSILYSHFSRNVLS